MTPDPVEIAARAHCFALEESDRKRAGVRSCPCTSAGECAVFERETDAMKAAIAAWMQDAPVTDAMKEAYGEAVYFTTDTRLLPENIFRAMHAALLEELERD